MATRATIAKLDNNGVKAIYLHSDGYLEYTGRILDEAQHFVSGSKRLNWDAPYTCEEINKKGRKLYKVLRDLEKACDGVKLIVGHNIDFDVGCIKYYDRYHSLYQFYKLPIFCTMKSTVNLCKLPFNNSRYSDKKEYKYPKLIELAKFLNIDLDDSLLHTASYDTYMTNKCFLKYLQLKSINIHDLLLRRKHLN